MRRLLAALAVGFVLAGCGGSAGGGEPGGTAALWVTRDRGAEVVLTATVPAGLTVLQALDREADVKTRYGGRFVQAINRIEGSVTKRRDWFYFLNGVEPDVGAAEVTLRPGDVAWWDFRSWKGRMEQPVVVGAFPEPFRHGWNGKPRPLEIIAPRALREERLALSNLLAPAGDQGDPNRFVLEVVAGTRGATLRARRGLANAAPVTFTLSGSEEAVRAAALALAKDPAIVRYHYTVRFDERGNVLG